MKTNLYLGKNPLYASAVPVAGQQVTLEGEAFYQIANYDRLRPFFMSIVSGGDHWMFISSTGALTAGRRACSAASRSQASSRSRSRVSPRLAGSVD